jgi:bifunctional non-homologous end joining protein LigD
MIQRPDGDGGRAIVAARPSRRHGPMPLPWSQVKTALDPKRFTIHTVPALLAKSMKQAA